MQTFQFSRMAGLVGICLLIHGCGHPAALYQPAPQPPLEVGRALEAHHKYAKAEAAYGQIEAPQVQSMTLNRLSSAWDGVNMNITRAQARVEQEPYLASARLTLAQQYYDKGLLCARYRNEAEGIYPHDTLAYEQNHYYSEALRQAQKAQRLDADLHDAALLMGEIYLANQMPTEALRELKSLISKHPNYAKGYYAIGKVYLDMQLYPKVERYFLRAIKLAPDMIEAYYELGTFYLQQQWYDDAAATFSEILRRQPTDTPSLDGLLETASQLGQYYAANGNYPRAIRIFEEILRVRPEYATQQRLLQTRAQQKKAAQQAEDAALEAKVRDKMAAEAEPSETPAP